MECWITHGKVTTVHCLLMVKQGVENLIPWLANKGKVVAPKQWFGENLKDKDTKDLYCEGWTVL